MLIAVIQVKEYFCLIDQIKQIHTQVDGIELRLDYADIIDVNIIANLRHLFTLPIIFTLRKKSQGGFYQHDEVKRLNDIITLCQLEPDYLDLEYDISHDFLQMIKLQYPHIKIICSYHQFDETPADLPAILQSLQHPCFSAYKIATYANKTTDALRMLQFVQKFHDQYILTGICMGEFGQCTRILSPIVGNAMNYASLNDSTTTASGQLSVHELLTTYRYRELNQHSKIYALLGDPVSHSVGHYLHNQAIQLLRKNAVYIKLQVTPDDLKEMIKQCQLLPFAGFSITMPLKECIVPLVHDISISSQTIHAINSIVINNRKWIGFNTDGIGAIGVLSEKGVDISAHTIIIIGAGGAAKAICYEARQHKASVIILNRTLHKARKLAKSIGCEAYHLNDWPKLKSVNPTILINTLPNSAYTEHNMQTLLYNSLTKGLVMDIVSSPINTLFLQVAKNKHCTCIYGYEMYINQALLQIETWFQSDEKQMNEIKILMKQHFLNSL